MKIALIRPITGVDNSPFFLPPIGLMYLASSLEVKGHSVKIIDAALTLETDEDIVEKLKIINPDIIGIGGIITAYNRVKNISFIIHETFSTIPLVLGGHIASHIPYVILSNMKCDFVVHGYGENTFCKLVDKIEKGGNSSDVKGISYINQSGDIVFNGFPDRLYLDELPFPAYHLVDMEKYIFGLQGAKMKEYVERNDLPVSLNKTRSMIVLASRGCVGKCSYCVHDITAYRGLQVHSLDKLFENISLLYEKYHIRNFLIGEEMFIFNERRRRNFIDYMDNNYPDAYYSFPVLANTINPAMCSDFEKSNCTAIGTGFESGSERILKLMKKKANAKQNKYAVKTMLNSKIPFGGSMMVGHPGENYETFIESMKFAKLFPKNKQMNVFYTTPYPGSLLYLWALQNGIIKDEDNFLSYISDVPASKLMINLTPYPDLILKCMRNSLVYANIVLNKRLIGKLFCKNPFEFVFRLIKLFIKLCIPKILLPIIYVYFVYRKSISIMLDIYKKDFVSQDINDNEIVVNKIDSYNIGGIKDFLVNSK